ncbi:MAG: hypothetical protein AB8U25_07465 [Rickettsiales endosymbiont of Dermacentor nuttalli]
MDDCISLIILNYRDQVLNIDKSYNNQFGSQSSGDKQFQNPYILAFNNNLNIVYVLDMLGNYVQIFDHEGNFLFRFGSLTITAIGMSKTNRYISRWFK